MKTLTRRQTLKALGLTLTLPLFESIFPAQAFAQVNGMRRRFIGIFSPNGSFMPLSGGIASNGVWNFNQALAPLVTAGHRNNTILFRGVNASTPQDPHWINTASFLSAAGQVQLGGNRPVGASRSFDQYVADLEQKSIRSLHVGWRTVNQNFDAAHQVYSDIYLERVAYPSATAPIANELSPNRLFNAVYSSEVQADARLEWMKSRDISILTVMKDQITQYQSRLSASDKSNLDMYLTSIRETERKLKTTVEVCQAPANQVISSSSHMEHFRIMQQIIADALACGITNVATIMYDTGVGDVSLRYPGVGSAHHGLAHAPNQGGILNVNNHHATLVANMITLLKERNLLSDTLVLWGSNMSNGQHHNMRNVPYMLIGQGTDLRFGQEVGTANANIPKGQIFTTLAPLYGINNMNSFGTGSQQGSGQLNIRV